MQILTFREADVPEDLRRQQMRLQEQAWPSRAGPSRAGPSRAGPSADGEPDPAPWHDPALAPRCMLLVVDGRVVSALDLLTKEIDHAGASYRAIGLSAVVTDVARRGQGHGARLVRAARAAIEGRNADLALFTSDPELRAFYLGTGWELLPDTVVVGGTRDDPYPSDVLGKLTFGAFLSPRARAERRSFIGGIELYPGPIDRLW